MIEGGFTHDALPDLFRYLCGRRESLWWELTTLAGTFSLVFEQGTPIDVMFSPTRPVGGRAGLKALSILFRQEGGRFTVYRGRPRQERRTLHLSGEQLLIELATLDDESAAPAVQRGVTVDLSAELELVGDLAPLDHRTAFRTSSQDVPLTDVLQLFSVSRSSYWINLLDPQGERAGRLLLSANEVLAAEYGQLRGQAAFTALLGHGTLGVIDVSPLPGALPTGQSLGDQSLGKLDALLMRELMSGRLNAAPDTAPVLPEAPAVRRDVGAAGSSTKERTGPDRGEGQPLLSRVLGLLGRGRAK